MSLEAPKIDKRTFDQIVEQTETLAQTYTGWQPPTSGDGKDMGSALIGVFGRMAELIVERLNRAPDKNLLAFLDMIGVQVAPPRPARVPLTFSLAANSPVDGLVPAGIQVAALPAEGDEEELVFETDDALVVTTTQLKAVFVREPGADQYADRTQAATGVVDEAFPAFDGYESIEHGLYLGARDKPNSNITVVNSLFYRNGRHGVQRSQTGQGQGCGQDIRRRHSRCFMRQCL